LWRCLDVPSGHPTAALLRETRSREGFAAPCRFYSASSSRYSRHATVWTGNPRPTLRYAYVSEAAAGAILSRMSRTKPTPKPSEPRSIFLFIHIRAGPCFAIYDRAPATSPALHTAISTPRTRRPHVANLRGTWMQAGTLEQNHLLITSITACGRTLARPLQRTRSSNNHVPAVFQTPAFIVKAGGGEPRHRLRTAVFKCSDWSWGAGILQRRVTTPRRAAAFWISAHSPDPVKSVAIILASAPMMSDLVWWRGRCFRERRSPGRPSLMLGLGMGATTPLRWSRWFNSLAAEPLAYPRATVWWWIGACAARNRNRPRGTDLPAIFANCAAPPLLRICGGVHINSWNLTAPRTHSCGPAGDRRIL